MTGRPAETSPAPHAGPSRLMAWLRALRLPFYPMSWLGYTLGATWVVPIPELWRMPAYWWGYAVVFLVEALTVFVNDLHDFESDRRNRNHGGFTGGSRVLVEGRLTRGDLRRACMVVAVGAVVAAGVLQLHSPAPAGLNLACLALAVLIGVGYTAPPLKLSHRGWGEVTVAFAHGVLVVQCGALVLGGQPGEAAVMKSALPLFFAILPSISLSGLPDMEADEAAGKRTLAVRFGPRAVMVFASAAAIMAALLVILWHERWPSWAVAGACLHGLVVVAAALSSWKRSQDRRIDGVMLATLSYVLWFTVSPLLSGVAR